MKPPCLTIGLVQAGSKLIHQVQVPEEVIWRMARRVQGGALRASLSQPCRVDVALLPQRGAPALASVLEIRLSPAPFAAGQEPCGNAQAILQVPLTALEPLIAEAAAQYRSAASLPPEATLGYVVLRPTDPPAGIILSGILPPFEARPAEPGSGHTPVFPNYDCENDAAVCVAPGVLESCAAWCRNSAVEKGGVLLGQVFQSAAGLWTEVLAFAPAEGATADATHLAFTLAAWQSIERCRATLARRLDLPGKLQVVGWVHGHPRLKQNNDNPFFLSSQDVAITAQHFREPYAVALVLDAQAEPGTPAAAGLAAFGWDAYGISLVPRSISLREPVSQPLYLPQEIHP